MKRLFKTLIGSRLYLLASSEKREHKESVAVLQRRKRYWLFAGAVTLALAGGARGQDVSVDSIIPIDLSSFSVRNYSGKCLDYSQPRTALLSGAVFLNDCKLAHQISVEEINDRHEVILHAGSKVLGINRPAGTSFEAPLEMQDRAASTGASSGIDQVFALDGDSIILASSRPCASTDGPNTTLCPKPPVQLVVQVQNARGANGSPIVVAPRSLLADSEFWDFNGFARYPTSGFVPVATNHELWNSICANPVATQLDAAGKVWLPPSGPCTDFKTGSWGRVIVVTSPNGCNHVPGPAPGQFQDIGGCIDLSGYPPVFLPAGLTVRGNRRGTNFGPQLYFAYHDGRNENGSRCGFDDDHCMLEVRGDYVRVTGLRMRGETRSTEEQAPVTAAIGVGPIRENFPYSNLIHYIATIDRNDISDWGGAAVLVTNPSYPVSGDCQGYHPDPDTLASVRVLRNFLHHNEKNSGGYGVHVGEAFIAGNTFVSNRHAIAAGGEIHNGYIAAYNLVLSSAPKYHKTFDYYNQDFDMHGTNASMDYTGGFGGYYVDIVGNTFLGTNRENYQLRGIPCTDTTFHENISLEKRDINAFSFWLGERGAVRYKDSDFTFTWDTYHINTSSTRNQFELPNPTNHLGVGDFDGDGVQDLFLATGSAWYYSSGGKTEWRFLSAKTEKLDNIRFGDFDGDGRTDVFTQIGDDWMVSWGGISNWEKINYSQWRMSDFYIGDFVGDSRADVFFARGDKWFVSDGGRGPFVEYAVSSFKLPDLVFGHFDSNHKYGDDTKLDVVGVVGNEWKAVYAQEPTHGWQELRPGPAPTKSMNGLIVGNFVNKNCSDIASVSANVRFDGQDGAGEFIWEIDGANWQVYPCGSGGRQNFTTSTPSQTFNLRPGQTIDVGPFAAIGKFSGRNGTDDILVWEGQSVKILPGGVSGTGVAQPHSTQDMR